MKLSEQVLCAIDDAEAGKFDAALLHACISIDTTSKRLYPSEQKVGVRYVDCLRRYYRLLEPMMGAGLNLVDTRFSNIWNVKMVRSGPKFGQIRANAKPICDMLPQ